MLEITNQEDYSEHQEKQEQVSKFEEEINLMVYKLYKLTYEEVKTIDLDFEITDEEYINYKI